MPGHGVLALDVVSVPLLTQKCARGLGRWNMPNHPFSRAKAYCDWYRLWRHRCSRLHIDLINHLRRRVLSVKRPRDAGSHWSARKREPLEQREAAAGAGGQEVFRRIGVCATGFAGVLLRIGGYTFMIQPLVSSFLWTRNLHHRARIRFAVSRGRHFVLPICHTTASTCPASLLRNGDPS